MQPYRAPGRNGKIMHPVIDNEIVDKRLAGMRYRDIASEIGLSKSYVGNVCRRAGIRAPISKPSGARYSVANVLRGYDSITVERGLSGGYIATIDDKYTGQEQRSVSKSIESALKEIRECTKLQ